MIQPNEPQPPLTVVSLSGPPLPVDLEFKRRRATAVFESLGLKMGRCFSSKSAYANAHPRRDFIPNANVFTRVGGKVWWGDLDLLRDRQALEQVARRLRCRLYVLREHDGRLDEADEPHAAVDQVAVWHTGGPARVAGVGRFLRESGLSPREAARLLKVSRGRLSGPQAPKTALEVGRRLRRFEEVFRPIGRRAGFGKWGRWWTSPHRKLGGRSPLAAMKSKEGLEIETLVPMTTRLHLFLIGYGAMRKL
jgi:hypothetical protein